MTTSVKSVIYKAAQIFGLYSILKKFRAGPIVLFYHGVEERIVDSRVQMLHVQLDLFEKQIVYLRKNFEIISLDDLYECISTGYRLDPSQVVITLCPVAGYT